MAECKDIDAALKRLESKIDTQNREIAGLKKTQQECCGNANHANNSNDLTDLKKRVANLESYCLSLEEALGYVSKSAHSVLSNLFGFISFFTSFLAHKR